MSIATESIITDLYELADGRKAELVDGDIVIMPPTGDMPAQAGSEIFVSLRQYARSTGHGRAYNDNAGFIVDLPHRQSFSPDAALYVGPRSGMRFLEGAPIFAVEVRSENDYGPRKERAISDKIADYFAAGTLVVWDVDLLGEDVVKVFRANDLEHPTIYRRGENAEAEPALPGWTFPVNDLFV
jgi:Uma2 family endonuclease